MRRLIRTTLSLAVLAALAAVMVSAAAAGNYAATSIVDGADTPPTVGEERELRILLLQHGVRPVDHGSVELIASLPGTDEAISVVATSVGGGEWLATVTFPTAGDWQLRILHSEFETPPASAFAVAPAGSTWLPAAASIAGLLLFAVAVIVVSRRWGGGAVATDPVSEPVRAG